MSATNQALKITETAIGEHAQTLAELDKGENKKLEELDKEHTQLLDEISALKLKIKNRTKTQ